MPRIDWLTNTFKAGDPLRKVANARQQNRIANILNGLYGIGCRVHKPTDGEGRGWAIICDGSSDTECPEGVITGDRRFAITDTDHAHNWSHKVLGEDTAASLYDTSTSMLVRWQMVDTGIGLVRLFIPAGNTITPTHALCRSSSNVLGWVSLGSCDT